MQLMRPIAKIYQNIRRRLEKRRRKNGLYRLRGSHPGLRFEPLESRRVLSFVVESFSPIPSGFMVDLSEEIDTSVLNLYDAENGALGAADVTLQGAEVGEVRGSLVVEGSRLTFLKTGGPLLADTYTATLRSASDGIISKALGELLDGEFQGAFPSGDGVAGGDFVFTFDVAPPENLIVSLPDFARGPTQDVRVPAQGSGQQLPDGLPIQLNDASGVTSILLTMTYDPALLVITDAELGPDAPSGSQVEINASVPGEVTIAFFSLAAMDTGQADVVNLIGHVPENATYASAQVLEISRLEVNAGAMAATADSALHVVAFPGDANANRRYDVEDARLVARVGVGLDSGFVVRQPDAPVGTDVQVTYPSIDPLIIADVSGDGTLSPLDASDLLRIAVGLETPNIPPLPSEQPPTDIFLSSNSIPVGEPAGTVVGVFSSEDPDIGDTHTYSFVTGEGDDHNDLFVIMGDELRTSETFDASEESEFSVRVRSTDSSGLHIDRVFVIQVVAEEELALVLSNNSVTEGLAIETVVGELATDDPEGDATRSFALVEGDGDSGNASFTIEGNELRTGEVFDVAVQDQYSIRVAVLDDEGEVLAVQVFTIQIAAAEEEELALVLSNNSVTEGLAIETVVGELSTNDPEGDATRSFALVEGDGDSGNASFTIDGNELRTGEVFDVAVQDQYSIRVAVLDDEGEVLAVQVFTIQIAAAEEEELALVLSNNSVTEGLAFETVVGELSTNDPEGDATRSFALVEGDGDSGNASFTIEGNELRTGEVFDVAVQDQYSIRVAVLDDEGEVLAVQVFTIQIAAAEEEELALVLSNNSVTEGLAIETVVGELSTNDPEGDATRSFALVEGDGDSGNASFTIDGNELRTGEVFDVAVQDQYSIRVAVLDDEGEVLAVQVFTIQIAAAEEEELALVLSNNSVTEGLAIETVVGELSTNDPEGDATRSFALVEGDGDSGNASFTIEGNELRTGEVFDVAVQDQYSIRVAVLDDEGEVLAVQVFTIQVAAAEEEELALVLSNNSVTEGLAIETVVGELSTNDPEGDATRSFALVEGDGDSGNASFTIDGNELRTGEVFDMAVQDQYSIRVAVLDDEGEVLAVQVFTIQVAAAEEEELALVLSNNSVTEGLAIETVVGELSTNDPEGDATRSFALVEGDGDSGNASFTIDGNELRTGEVFDVAVQDQYSIRVAVLDDEGEVLAVQVFTIQVAAAEEEELALVLSNNSVTEGLAIETVVGELSTNDPEGDATRSFALVEGDGDSGNASFTIDGNELRTGEVFDVAVQDQYSIRVAVLDDEGEVLAVQVFTIQIAAAEEE
jgi:uncharacterized protein GlcG (DUF336 family)